MTQNRLPTERIRGSTPHEMRAQGNRRSPLRMCHQPSASTTIAAGWPGTSQRCCTPKRDWLPAITAKTNVPTVMLPSTKIARFASALSFPSIQRQASPPIPMKVNISSSQCTQSGSAIDPHGPNDPQ